MLALALPILVGEVCGPLPLPYLILELVGGRVAKCHFFTQIISVQPNLTQEKARKSRQVFYIESIKWT